MPAHMKPNPPIVMRAADTLRSRGFFVLILKIALYKPIRPIKISRQRMEIRLMKAKRKTDPEMNGGKVIPGIIPNDLPRYTKLSAR